MSFIKKSLGNNENILVIMKIHIIFFFFSKLLRLFITYVLIAIPLYALNESTASKNNLISFLSSLFIIWLFYLCTEAGITNRRVIFKKGLLNLKTNEMLLHEIETVKYKASFIQRIFSIGTITVTGTGSNDVVFKNIFYPMEIKRRLDDIIITIKKSQA